MSKQTTFAHTIKCRVRIKSASRFISAHPEDFKPLETLVLYLERDCARAEGPDRGRLVELRGGCDRGRVRSTQEEIEDGGESYR